MAIVQRDFQKTMWKTQMLDQMGIHITEEEIQEKAWTNLGFY